MLSNVALLHHRCSAHLPKGTTMRWTRVDTHFRISAIGHPYAEANRTSLSTPVQSSKAVSVSHFGSLPRPSPAHRGIQ